MINQLLQIAKTRRLHVEISNITTGHPDTILPQNDNIDEATEQTMKQLDNIGSESEIVWKRKHVSAEIPHPAENMKK